MPNPHHYALVVGINEYPGIGSLTKPVQDAKDFYDWLIDPNKGGLEPGHCKCEFQDNPYYPLTPQQVQALSPAEKRRHIKPQIDDIKDKLLDLLELGLKLRTESVDDWESSRLYIFVAGHGMASGIRDADLFLADAGDGYYTNRMSCDKLLDSLVTTRTAFREVVIFADCCRSYKSVAGKTSFNLEDKSYPKWEVRHAVGYASLFDDPSYESITDDGRGFFTRALLEGLNGRAAPIGKEITMENLRISVTDQLKRLTKGIPKGPQKADFHAPDEIVLLKCSPGWPAEPAGNGGTISLKFLHFTGQVQLLGPDLEPVAGVPPFNAVPGAVWQLPHLPNAIRRVDARNGNANLIAKGGYFSWKDVPLQNGVSQPIEM